jgi:hypothetical protein
VGRGRQLASGVHAQAFFFNASADASQAGGRECAQAFVNAGHAWVSSNGVGPEGTRDGKNLLAMRLPSMKLRKSSSKHGKSRVIYWGGPC